MVENYKIITLCGSIKFKDDFLSEQKRLTLAGNIVLTLGIFPDELSEKLSEETISMLGDMHKRRIDMSDEILVINKGGYIGSSTRSEIEYATKTNKKVNYVEPIN